MNLFLMPPRVRSSRIWLPENDVEYTTSDGAPLRGCNERFCIINGFSLARPIYIS